MVQKRGFAATQLFVATAIVTAVPIGLFLSMPAGGSKAPLGASGCACSSEGNTELSTQLACEYIEVLDGARFDLVNSNGVKIAGDWEASFGKVDSSGTYTAPLELEEPRIDTLTLKSSSNPSIIVAQLRFHVADGNPSPDPGAESHTWMDSPVQEGQQTSNANVQQLSMVDDGLTAPQATFQLTELVNIQPQVIGTVTAYPVTNLVGGTVVLLSGPTQPQKGKKCRIFPGKDDISGSNCGPGFPDATRGGGPRGQLLWKEDHGAWKAVSGNYTVDANLEGKGLGLTAGWSFPGSYQRSLITEYAYNDVYKCKNGVYVYDHSEKCARTRYSYKAFDPSYLNYLILPPNGISPGPWSPPNPECKPI